MDKSQLMALTIKELRECAEILGVKGGAALKQNQLVDAIVQTAADADIAAAVKRVQTAKITSDNQKTVEKSAKNIDTAAATAKKIQSAQADVDVLTDDDDKLTASDKTVAKKTTKKSVNDETSDDETADDETETKEKAEAKDDEKSAKDVPVEPDSIFIDRGAVLPEYVPGTCLYVLVRDPGTLFVYWNAAFESQNGWLLSAYDANGNLMQSFTTPAPRNGRGYFRLPTARVARVTLSVIHQSGENEVKLESHIRIAEQLHIAQPHPDERWVDVQKREVIYEAPSKGSAPHYDEALASHRMNVAGGGFDRSMEKNVCDGQTPSQASSLPSSSRFGSLSAPSSDVFSNRR